ncbi:hypothetical protein HHI36_006747 [Cryptolaemus montrouzieri]|uniref:Lysine--tRNA ligase n=1 Tax=Cryptolaemus montrouzieri TaxID=559131 RepID=A0ABD2NY00_9CUCU
MGDATISKNELKRRQKALEKQQKQAEKQAEKIAAEAAQPTKQKLKKEDEDISPNEYYKLRTGAIQKLKGLGGDNDPYPHKFNVTISLQGFIEKYSYLKEGEAIDTDVVSVAGRVHAIRESGAKLIFYDLRGEGTKLQVMATAASYESETKFIEDTDKIRRGDIIGVEGYQPKRRKANCQFVRR